MKAQKILVILTLVLAGAGILSAEEKRQAFGIGAGVGVWLLDNSEETYLWQMAAPFLRSGLEYMGIKPRLSLTYRYEILDGWTLGARMGIGAAFIGFVPVPDLHPYLTTNWEIVEGFRLGLELGYSLGIGMEFMDTWYLSINPGWSLGGYIEPGFAIHYQFTF